MRMTDIAVFMFCFAVMASAFMVTVPEFMGGPTADIIFPDVSGTIPTPDYVATRLNEAIIGATIAGAVTGIITLNYYQAQTAAMVGFLIFGWSMLSMLFAPWLMLGTYLRSVFPFIPFEFEAAINTITWIVFVVGTVQYISGRSEKMMR